MRYILAPIAALTILLITSCMVAKKNDDSDLRFAVLGSYQDSILKWVHQKNGAVDVCIGLIGFPNDEVSTATTRYEDLVRDTLSLYHKALSDHPDWQGISSFTPAFTIQKNLCAAKLGIWTINVYHNRKEFEATNCTDPNWFCATQAFPERHEIIIGPVNRGHPVSIYDSFTVRHEFGHIVGLGDTYKVEGSHDWDGEQPLSLMNGQAVTITADDKLGLWATWNFMKSGQRSCVGYGDEVTMKNNGWNSILCDPSALPVIRHDADDWLCGDAAQDVRVCLRPLSAYLGVDAKGEYNSVRAEFKSTAQPNVTTYAGTLETLPPGATTAVTTEILVTLDQTTLEATLHYKRPQDPDMRPWSQGAFSVSR